jgi:hypothetical protein
MGYWLIGDQLLVEYLLVDLLLVNWPLNEAEVGYWLIGFLTLKGFEAYLWEND